MKHPVEKIAIRLDLPKQVEAAAVDAADRDHGAKILVIPYTRVALFDPVDNIWRAHLLHERERSLKRGFLARSMGAQTEVSPTE